MSAAIHPTAIVDKQVELAAGVTVGPYAIIEGPVTVGQQTTIGPHACLRGPLTIGEGNAIHFGALLGGAPQHLAYQRSRGGVRIGDRNVFREYATVHRSMDDDRETVIGHDNFFMGFSHVAHDCTVGNQVIMANHALLAGHAVVEDQAFLSGHVAVHQFVRIGRLAMVGGVSRINQDVPPFMLVKGDSEIWSLNLVGLRRARLKSEIMTQLKQAFTVLCIQGHTRPQAIAEIQRRFPHPAPELTHLLTFLQKTRRGICAYRGGPPAEEFPETP